MFQRVEIIQWVQGFENAFFDFFFDAVSWFGEEYFYIVVLGFIYWAISKRFGGFVAMTLASGIAFNNVLKDLVAAPRPFDTHGDSITNKRPGTATGMSFPSGHVQNSGTFFFAIALYLKKRAWLVLAIVMTILMMISRVYLGVHYLEDVIVGAILAVLTAIALHALFVRFMEDEKLLLRLYIALALIFLPFFFILQGNDFFRGYGILVGLVVSIAFERRYVGFTYDVEIWKKAVRVIVGLVLMVVVLTGVGAAFRPIENPTFLVNVLAFIRYFLVAFIGFGLYPMAFKKFGF